MPTFSLGKDADGLTKCMTGNAVQTLYFCIDELNITMNFMIILRSTQCHALVYAVSLVLG